MKKQFCKTMSYVMTAALLLGVSMPSSPAAAKKKAPKLSTKKVSISVGQKKTIKLKNGKKAVWSIKSGKKVVSLSKKKKTSVVVKGKKAGKNGRGTRAGTPGTIGSSLYGAGFRDAFGRGISKTAGFAFKPEQAQGAGERARRVAP